LQEFQVQTNFIEFSLQYACVPGSTLLPDFFLDEYDDHAGSIGAKKPAAAEKSGSGKISELFGRIGKHLSPELVSQAQAVYQFNVSGATVSIHP